MPKGSSWTLLEYHFDGALSSTVRSTGPRAPIKARKKWLSRDSMRGAFRENAEQWKSDQSDLGLLETRPAILIHLSRESVLDGPAVSKLIP